MKKIIFDLNGDNRPHIEGFEDFKTSIFCEQYEQCVSLVDSYLKGLNNIQASPERLASSLESSNNIIVFDGERGSGKTSCMMSIVNMLTDDEHAKICGNCHYAANIQFDTIQMIEPAFFDKEHNILSLFIARLYRAFQDTEETPWKLSLDRQTASKLNQKFVEVQRKLRCMFNEEWKSDGLEYLVDMASAVDIKDDIREMIDLYLKYRDKSKGVLLLMVDDIDLNDDNAYAMAEQLRKYFIQPNLIVMMSMKVRQLFGILQRDFRSAYGFSRTDAEEIEIAERSERYLAKLLPAHQRIYMPEPATFMNAALEVKNAEDWGYALMEGIKIEQVIPELIFIKTRYLFYNTKKHISYIVPRNLRDLRQLLKLLVQMPNYSNEDETVRHTYNKKQFLQYFINDWRDINLKEEYRHDIDEILSVRRIDELNYTMISMLSEFSESTLYYRFDQNVVDNLTDVRNRPYNISLGDVMTMMKLVEGSMMNDDSRKFLFFLKSLYSFRLYEAYDSITSSNEKTVENDNPQVKIQKREHGITLNDYEAMTAGCLFNEDVYPLIPNTLTNQELVRRKISVSELSELFRYCVNNWEDARGLHLIELAEVLMLCIQYDVSKENIDGKYRRSVDLHYDSFGLSQQLVFNLGALFFNLCRIDRCYRRFTDIPFGQTFLHLLENDKNDIEKRNSVLAFRLKKSALVARPKVYKTEEERWLSCCCFRNMEIIEDFLDTVRETEYTDRSDAYKTIREFFHVAASYHILSYDRDKAWGSVNLGSPYHINFNFFSQFEELFSDEHQKLKEWFLKIYQSSVRPESYGKREKISGDTSST